MGMPSASLSEKQRLVPAWTKSSSFVGWWAFVLLGRSFTDPAMDILEMPNELLFGVKVSAAVSLRV